MSVSDSVSKVSRKTVLSVRETSGTGGHTTPAGDPEEESGGRLLTVYERLERQIGGAPRRCMDTRPGKQ
jgi:hypothetical protein